jgi:hypothetical protein
MRYRVIETLHGYLVQSRHRWWPFWLTDEDEYGPRTYGTFCDAAQRALRFMQRDREEAEYKVRTKRRGTKVVWESPR